jgi:ABC-type cobalamin/Fe3+-siderophores transport system ATPase subunit
LISNPFSTRFIRPGAIPFCFADPIDRDQQLQRLSGQVLLRQASLIVGPHGSGKTTLLHALRPRLEQQMTRVESVMLHSSDVPGIRAKWVGQRQNSKSVRQIQKELPPESLLIVDGIEQLSRRGRQSVLTRARSHRHRVLATAHTALDPFTVIYETRIRPETIVSITQRLTEHSHAKIKDLVGNELTHGELSKVSNVRDFLFELYDCVAHFQGDQHPDSN